MNSVTLLGRIGQEPELKYTNSGQALVNASMATNEVWTKDGQRQEKTEWHELVFWGKTAEIAGKYVHKGDQLLVTGRLQTRSWVDRETNGKRYITEIVCLGSSC